MCAWETADDLSLPMLVGREKQRIVNSKEFKIQSILTTHGFCIWKFTYSLNFIRNPSHQRSWCFHSHLQTCTERAKVCAALEVDETMLWLPLPALGS